MRPTPTRDLLADDANAIWVALSFVLIICLCILSLGVLAYFYWQHKRQRDSDSQSVKNSIQYESLSNSESPNASFRRLSSSQTVIEPEDDISESETKTRRREMNDDSLKRDG
jgi:cbb3-type cytochrome oxidase subunit 3